MILEARLGPLFEFEMRAMAAAANECVLHQPWLIGQRLNDGDFHDAAADGARICRV
jgi:hypothetical protein